MKRGLIVLGLALAAAPSAYACFVAAWQLATFTGFAVRLEDSLPGEAWRDIGFTALQMIVIAASLLILLQAVQARRYRKAAIALAVAWAGSAPVAIMVLRSF